MRTPSCFPYYYTMWLNNSTSRGVSAPTELIIKGLCAILGQFFQINNYDYLKKARKYGQITGWGHRIYYQITTFGMSLDTLTTSREMPRPRRHIRLKLNTTPQKRRSLIPLWEKRTPLFLRPNSERRRRHVFHFRQRPRL